MSLKDIDIKRLGTEIQIAGALYADKDQSYLVMLPGEDATRPSKVVTLTPDEWETFLRQTDLVEVECLVKDPQTKQIGKAMLRKTERNVSQVFSWQVYRRDGYKCRYCGADDVPLTVDHLITWESGGPSTPENLVACCRRCNAARGETPYAEWLDSPHYQKVSQGISYQERFANEALIATLGKIPVSVRVGKRTR